MNYVEGDTWWAMPPSMGTFWIEHERDDWARDLSAYMAVMEDLLKALTCQLKTCQPRPLKIDGHAYRRKTRARRNRR